MKPLSDNKAFCVLPFIHRHQRLSGFETLCCLSSNVISRKNKKHLDGLRKKMIDGEPIDNCKICYETEKTGLISSRILENNRWLNDEEVADYINNWNVDSEERIFTYDLRHSNICNLACIPCGPHASSLWAKELKVNIPIVKSLNFDECISAKYIYLAGGEPFLVSEFIDLLQKISLLDEQPFITINTNLTIQNEDIAIICQKLKKLTLNVSVDGYGKTMEYNRYPLKWDKFIKNLEWTRTLNCNVRFNSIVNALTVYSMHELMRIEDYCYEWGLTPVQGNDALLLHNLPDMFKQQAFNNFNNLKKSRFYISDSNFRKTVDTFSEMILMPGDSTKLIKFVQEIDSRRKINHETYLGIKLY